MDRTKNSSLCLAVACLAFVFGLSSEGGAGASQLDSSPVAQQASPAQKFSTTIFLFDAKGELTSDAIVQLHSQRAALNVVPADAPGTYSIPTLDGDRIDITFDGITQTHQLPARGGMLKLMLPAKQQVLSFWDAETDQPIANELFGFSGPGSSPAVKAYVQSNANGEVGGFSTGQPFTLIPPDGYTALSLDGVPFDQVATASANDGGPITFAKMTSSSKGKVPRIELIRQPQIELLVTTDSASLQNARGTVATQIYVEHNSAWRTLGVPEIIQLVDSATTFRPKRMFGESRVRQVFTFEGAQNVVLPMFSLSGDLIRRFDITLQPVAMSRYELLASNGEPLPFAVAALDHITGASYRSVTTGGAVSIALPTANPIDKLAWITPDFQKHGTRLRVREGISTKRSGELTLLNVSTGQLKFEGNGATPTDFALGRLYFGVWVLGKVTDESEFTVPVGEYVFGTHEQMVETLRIRQQNLWVFGGGFPDPDGIGMVAIRDGEVSTVQITPASR